MLTERGRDFRSVLGTLMAFGNRHFAPEGASIMIVDAVTGEPAEPVLVDRRSGRPLVEPDFVLAPGPAANAATVEQLANRKADMAPPAKTRDSDA